MNLTAFYSARAGWRNAGEERMRQSRAVALAGDVGRIVLDIGCRDGGLRDHLPDGVAYFGIDIAPEFESQGIFIANADEGIPFPTFTFDTVFAVDSLEYMTNPAQVLREIRRVLRPHGTAVVSVPNPYHLKEIVWNLFRMPDRQGHIHSWTRQSFTALVNMMGFDVVDMTGTYWLYPIPAHGLLARSIIYKLRA